MAHTQRSTVDLSTYPDLVVIYLEMKVQTWRGLGTLVSFGPKISAAVDPKPEGLLFTKAFSIPFSRFIRVCGNTGGTFSLWRTGPGHCRIKSGGRAFCRIPVALASGMRLTSCGAA